MRATIFFIFLCSSLLWGKHSPVESTHHHCIHLSLNQDTVRDQQANYTTADQDSSIIEDSDLDLAEENPMNHNVAKKLFEGQCNLSYIGHFPFFHPCLLNYHLKGLKTSPYFYIHSFPIYIKNRSLRI